MGRPVHRGGGGLSPSSPPSGTRGRRSGAVVDARHLCEPVLPLRAPGRGGVLLLARGARCSARARWPVGGARASPPRATGDERPLLVLDVVAADGAERRLPLHEDEQRLRVHAALEGRAAAAAPAAERRRKDRLAAAASAPAVAPLRARRRAGRAQRAGSCALERNADGERGCWGGGPAPGGQQRRRRRRRRRRLGVAVWRVLFLLACVVSLLGGGGRSGGRGGRGGAGSRPSPPRRRRSDGRATGLHGLLLLLRWHLRGERAPLPHPGQRALGQRGVHPRAAAGGPRAEAAREGRVEESTGSRAGPEGLRVAPGGPPLGAVRGRRRGGRDGVERARVVRLSVRRREASEEGCEGGVELLGPAAPAAAAAAVPAASKVEVRGGRRRDAPHDVEPGRGEE